MIDLRTTDFRTLSIDEAGQVEETYERQCNAGRLGRFFTAVVATAIVLLGPAYIVLVKTMPWWCPGCSS